MPDDAMLPDDEGRQKGRWVLLVTDATIPTAIDGAKSITTWEQSSLGLGLVRFGLIKFDRPSLGAAFARQFYPAARSFVSRTRAEAYAGGSNALAHLSPPRR